MSQQHNRFGENTPGTEDSPSVFENANDEEVSELQTKMQQLIQDQRLGKTSDQETIKTQ